MARRKKAVIRLFAHYSDAEEAPAPASPVDLLLADVARLLAARPLVQIRT